MTAPGGMDTRDAQVNLYANVGAYQQQMDAAASSTSRAASAVDQLDQKLDNLAKKAGKKLFTLSAADFAALSGATADAADFQKQLSTLNATAAVTGTSFKGIKSGIEQAFQAFPTARGQIVALAETISDLGVTAPRDIGTLITTFIKLGAATGEGIQPLAQGLVMLSRLMGNTDAQQIGNYANSLLTVSKNSGVSATGVLSFAQSIAPMARQAGIGEAAVLGISAAFSKAGADGYVAANTFNGIVSSITQLTQSGSPQLSQYANLIGVTLQQFKNMSGQQQITQILDVIGKQGPAAINTLQRLGFDGVRAQSAIAAVTQSGDLQQAIATATGSSTNQKNLDKGSRAAFDNLSDGLARLRNEFAEFGAMIGTTFLTPLSKMVDTLANVGSKLNDFLRPFAPIIAGLAAIAGGFAAVGGAALSVAAVIGTVGLAKLAINSGPIRALREGVAVGRGGVGGAEVVNASSTRYAANASGAARMPLRTRIPYIAGTSVGQTMPPPVDEAEAAGASTARQVGRAALRAPFVAATGFVRSSTRLSADEARNDYERSFYNKNPDAGTGFRATAGAAISRNKENTEEMTSFQALMAATKELAQAMIGAAVQVTKTGAHVMNPMNWRTNPSTGMVDEEGAPISGAAMAGGGMLGRSAGRVAGGAANLGRGAMGMLGGPLGIGIVAAIVAPMVIGSLKGAVGNLNAGDLSGGTNAITRYDQALGTSSSALGSFTSAVNSATSAAKQGAPTSLGQAATVSAADKAATAGNYKVTDTQLESIQRGKNNVAAAQQYIETLSQQSGGLTPAKLQAIKQDLISIFGSGPAAQILGGLNAIGGGFGASPTVNYATLGQNANGQSVGRFRSLAGNVQSTIQSQQKAVGTQAGNAQALQNLLTYGGSALAGQGGNPGAQQSVQSLLAGVLGGKSSDYDLTTGITGPNKNSRTPGRTQINAAFGTAGSSQAQILKTIKSTAAGKAYLSSLGLDPSTASDADILSVATNNGRTASQQTAYQKQVAGVGPIGGFALGDQTVQAAQANPGSANAQTAGSMALYNQAKGVGNSLQSVSQAMDDLKGAVKDTTDPLYQMADAAKAYAAAQDQFNQAGMSQEGKLADLAKNYQQAQSNATMNPNDPSAQADLQTQQANYQQGLTSYTQYVQSMQQAAISFGTQMERAQQDQNLSIFRSNQQFYIQQTQAQQDFNRQNMLSVRDFGIQMERQAQSEAEQIYNPFQRVQAQYTIDAGTLIQNLANQNDLISQQYANLQQLSQMGVSQSAIDTLQLADPTNAQQTNALVQSLVNNPQLVQQINAAVATRVQATTTLTQSSFSETFRNTTADFARQLSDTADAYNIQKQRAVDAQSLSLSQMAQDYNTMVQRSAQDLNTSMTQIFGDYATSYTNTMQAISTDIGKYAPGIAATLGSELTGMATTLQNILNPAAVAAAATAGHGSATAGHHAAGGVSTFAHVANISEGNNPEAIIPLDQRGLQFMTSFANQVSMAMLRQMNVGQYPSQPTGANTSHSTNYSVDQSTNIDTVNVTANDIKSIQSDLAKLKRYKALSLPPASTAAATTS